MILYGYDDESIGKLGPNKRNLMSKELRRPPGLNMNEWYVLAQQICGLLNKIMKDR